MTNTNKITTQVICGYRGRHRKPEEPKDWPTPRPGVYPPFVQPPVYQPPMWTCTCAWLWNSITPPPPCPLHGYFYPVHTITTNTTISGQVLNES